MSDESSNGKMDEQKLVKLYTELTGIAESSARAVFMFVSSEGGAPARVPSEVLPRPVRSETAGQAIPATPRRAMPPAIAALAISSLLLVTQPARSNPVEPASVPQTQTISNAVQVPWEHLSLADAVNVALARNPDVRRARKDIEATEGVVIQTRAIALPTFGINGSYAAVQRTDTDIFEAPGFTFGTPQNWVSQVKLVQNFYQGGRILSAFRVGRLLRQQTLLNYQTTLADTVLNVQLAYYDVLMAQEQITVEEASVELLTRELADTTRRYKAGTVPRFNVLRAEVELANQRPRLINARNSLRISKNNLANLLGYDVPRGTFEDIPLNLTGKLQAEPYEIELPRAVSLALEHRTELASLLKAQALRKEDLLTAKAGYKPSLQGYVGYDVHNSLLSQDLTYVDKGWIAGVQLSWNIFDGFLTQGRINQASANYERAGIDLDDTARRIELQVRTAYSSFIEAREVLESQKKVQEEAEEALRLATARNEAGTGTQLDVLSAQTALTDARSTQVQALHDYSAALARLQRSLGMNVPTEVLQK